jgi:hypothetical protein
VVQLISAALCRLDADRFAARSCAVEVLAAGPMLRVSPRSEALVAPPRVRWVLRLSPAAAQLAQSDVADAQARTLAAQAAAQLLAVEAQPPVALAASVPPTSEEWTAEGWAVLRLEPSQAQPV